MIDSRFVLSLDAPVFRFYLKAILGQLASWRTRKREKVGASDVDKRAEDGKQGVNEIRRNNLLDEWAGSHE
jgi:hypothetical protein